MVPLLLSVALLLTSVTSTPLSLLQSRETNLDPVINANFPDPSILYDGDTWYAFATNNGVHNVQVASSPSISGPWTILAQDLLPITGIWSNGANVWAPDIRKVGPKYVLYYTAEDASSTAQHCVGTATSDTILGTYTPDDTALACPLSQGGAIDPAGFTDADGTHYVVYKVDGSSIGNGGRCGNTVAPIVPTPIMLQQLAADGTTPVGSPVQILDRGTADGPLIEAPSLILYAGVYVLFFSSNCYSTPQYDISYATATSIMGPYTKSSAPLAITGDPFNLTAPGGATAGAGGKNMVFHANCDAGRCMYEHPITISGTTVTFS